jgi:uncharacterized alpha/beta hydrolase family protein
VDWRTLLISMALIGMGAGLSGSAFQAYIADVARKKEYPQVMVQSGDCH